jgi:hypothetical protein
MPNIQEYRAAPMPGETAGFIARSWRIPKDDNSFIRFDIRLYPPGSQNALSENRRPESATASPPWSVTDLAQAIVRGEESLTVVSKHPELVGGDFAIVLVQDCAVMSSLGPIEDSRHDDLLGNSDLGVSRIRALWTRELRDFAAGAPPKRWIRPASLWDDSLAAD